MANKWIEHLKKVKKENPKKSLSECMTLAKKSYKKVGKWYSTIVFRGWLWMVKNKKGEVGLSTIILMAVALIVGLAILPAIFSQQSVMTDTFGVTYEDYEETTNISGSQALRGQEIIGSYTIVNATGVEDCTTNYTLSEGIDVASNTKRVLITHVGSADEQCYSVNVSYTAGGEGYVDNAGGRSIAGLIGLLSAIALLGAAIFYFMKNSEGILNR